MFRGLFNGMFRIVLRIVYNVADSNSQICPWATWYTSRSPIWPYTAAYKTTPHYAAHRTRLAFCVALSGGLVPVALRFFGCRWTAATGMLVTSRSGDACGKRMFTRQLNKRIRRYTASHTCYTSQVVVHP